MKQDETKDDEKDGAQDTDKDDKHELYYQLLDLVNDENSKDLQKLETEVCKDSILKMERNSKIDKSFYLK